MDNSSGVGLLKNIMSLGVVQILNYVFPLISIPIISRIIGPENFGTINYLASFVTYFTLLISYGFDLTATRRMTADPRNLALRNQIFGEVFTAQLFLFVLSCLIFWICLQTVPSLYSSKQAATFTFIICIASVFTQNWLFQAMQELSKLAILSFISKALFTMSVLLIVRDKDDYIWQPLVASVCQILVSIAAFFYAYKRYEITLKVISLARVFSLLKQESTVFFSLVVVNLYTTTNIVMLGLLTSNKEVGFYTAALRLIQVSTAVINIPLSQAIFPFIGRAFSLSKEEGFTKVREVIPLVVWITSIVGLGMFFIGPYVLIWFYGDAFSPSVNVFRVLAFIPLVVALNNMFGTQVMLNLKLDREFFLITLVGAIIGLVLNYILVSQFSEIGAATNWLVVEIYITFAMYYYLKKKGMNVLVWEAFKPSNIQDQLKPLLSSILKRKT